MCDIAIRSHAIGLAALVVAVAGLADAEPAPRVKQVKNAVARDERGSVILRAIYAPAPQYSRKMRLHQEQGEGVYVLLLRPNGTVSGVAVVRSAGSEELDIAAAQALIRWRFPAPPAGLKGVRVPINFRLGTPFSGGRP